jgi:multidrug efflux pump subunit AcrA (membrane-fusion protein)
VKKEDGREFVYLAKNDKAEKRFIETGVVSGINVEVLEGLNPGDKLITKGDALVENGVKIKITDNSK